MHVILRQKTKIQSHYAMYIGDYSIKNAKKKEGQALLFSTITSC